MLDNETVRIVEDDKVLSEAVSSQPAPDRRRLFRRLVALAALGGLTSLLLDQGGGIPKIAAQSPVTTPGTASAGQVAFFDASTDITGDPNLFWDNTHNFLGLATGAPKRVLDVNGNVWLGGASSSSYPAPGVGALIVGSSSTSSISTATLVSNVSGTANAIGALSWANYNVAGTEKRLAQIVAYTDGATNSGLLKFYTTAAGTLSEALRIDKSKNVSMIGADASAALHLRASISSFASLRIPAGTAPTTPGEGDLWNDSTQKALTGSIGGIPQKLTGCIFTGKASATVGNTTNETSILPTGVGTSTLPANFFVAGKTIRIDLYGYFTSSTFSPSLRIRIKLGSTIVLDTGAVQIASGTNNYFKVEAVITCRTTGSSGTVQGEGNVYLSYGSGSSPTGLDMVTTSATTINTGSPQTIGATAQWGAASVANTITVTNAIIEVLN